LQANDVQTMNDIITYLLNEGPAADGRHERIDNWFYW
jgi:hypothetical protein